MHVRRIARVRIFAAFVTLVAAVIPRCALAQQSTAPKVESGQLTVDRIYSQPSLSGRLTRGISWSPDGKKLSFFETKGTNVELWSMDPSSGERTLLIPADKLETVLPPLPKQTQATGAGRHAPSQYLWAPSGDALLFVATESLAWFDLKTQAARVLVSGKAAL